MNVFEERIEIRRTSVSMDESRWMLSYLTRRRGAPVRRHNLEGDRSAGFSLQETRNMREREGNPEINTLSLSLSSPFYFAPPSDSLRFLRPFFPFHSSAQSSLLRFTYTIFFSSSSSYPIAIPFFSPAFVLDSASPQYSKISSRMVGWALTSSFSFAHRNRSTHIVFRFPTKHKS